MKIKINRIARGSLALFALKLSLICVFLIVQACKDSVAPEDPLVKFSSFLSSERVSIVDRINLNKDQVAGSVISESEAKEVLTNTLEESMLLLKHFGFQEDEFMDESGSIDNIVVIFTALAVLEAENRFNNRNTYASSLFFNEAQAYGVGTCILEAIGVGALYDWAVGKAVLSRRMLIRAVGKTLSRTIGWVGTALAVADFVWCMSRE